jgi:glycosyltransferase involved in cell wall biosynthesis
MIIWQLLMSNMIRELILVNDGSYDGTGVLADAFAGNNPNIKVLHHIVKLNLGNALKTDFANAKGQYTITIGS